MTTFSQKSADEPRALVPLIRGWQLVERGLVTRVCAYSCGNCVIEVRGETTDDLYQSARNRYDRKWTEGERVDIYRPATVGQRVVDLESHSTSFRLSFHPCSRDSSEDG